MTLHRFERGERTLGFLEIVDLARALGMDPVELFEAGLEEQA